MFALELNLHALLGEGPVWDGRTETLYWVDGLGNKIHRYFPGTGKNETLHINQNIGCIAVCADHTLVMALQDGIWIGDMDQGPVQLLSAPEAGLPRNRFNDGKCDVKGRLWCGTMSKIFDHGGGAAPPTGSLYLYNPKTAHTEKKLSDLFISNGLGWSPDQSVFYHIDTLRHCVSAFDFDVESGEISNRRTAVTVPEEMGNPDGMCVDSEGMLWIALWNGWAISRWNPQNGTLIQKYDLPVRHVTSCCFGGKELDTLYITTASIDAQGTAKPQPFAGALFSMQPGVTGVNSYRFAYSHDL